MPNILKYGQYNLSILGKQGQNNQCRSLGVIFGETGRNWKKQEELGESFLKKHEEMRWNGKKREEMESIKMCQKVSKKYPKSIPKYLKSIPKVSQKYHKSIPKLSQNYLQSILKVS